MTNFTRRLTGDPSHPADAMAGDCEPVTDEYAQDYDNIPRPLHIREAVHPYPQPHQVSREDWRRLLRIAARAANLYTTTVDGDEDKHKNWSAYDTDVGSEAQDLCDTLDIPFANGDFDFDWRSYGHRPPLVEQNWPYQIVVRQHDLGVVQQAGYPTQDEAEAGAFRLIVAATVASRIDGVGRAVEPLFSIACMPGAPRTSGGSFPIGSNFVLRHPAFTEALLRRLYQAHEHQHSARWQRHALTALAQERALGYT